MWPTRVGRDQDARVGTGTNSSSFLLNLGNRRGAWWRLSAGLVLPQGLCESLSPHSSWTPVRAAGEADAKHLPMGHTLAAAPRCPSPHSGKPGRAIKPLLGVKGPSVGAEMAGGRAHPACPG